MKTIYTIDRHEMDLRPFSHTIMILKLYYFDWMPPSYDCPQFN